MYMDLSPYYIHFTTNRNHSLAPTPFFFIGLHSVLINKGGRAAKKQERPGNTYHVMLTQGGCRRGDARLQIRAQWTWGQGSSRVLVILWTSKVFSSDGVLIDEVLYIILMWTPPHLHPPHVHWHHSRDPWPSPFFTTLPCIILNANWRPEKKANHSCEWDPVICVQPACSWITTLKHVTSENIQL